MQVRGDQPKRATGEPIPKGSGGDRLSDTKVDVFVHCQGAQPQVVEGVPGEKIRDVLLRVEIAADDSGFLLFLGESDGASAHAPVDPNSRLESLDGPHRHIHCYRCSEVAVDVNFGGGTEQIKVSPATTIATVTSWARQKFNLDDPAASEYQLRFCGADDRQPRPDEYLGELDKGNCALCFNLVKELVSSGVTPVASPDARLFEADLRSARFRNAVVNGWWDLAGSDIADIAWASASVLDCRGRPHGCARSFFSVDRPRGLSSQRTNRHVLGPGYQVDARVRQAPERAAWEPLRESIPHRLGERPRLLPSLRPRRRKRASELAAEIPEFGVER